ncbi:hypothetical protein J6590_086876 [Homalodisca vitripennis]|nr:hypothetical protein J6590_086876 [Homalodisca vitripennis]
MGLTAVFLCPESHRTQIREGKEGAHWFDSQSFCASHIVLRLEREEERSSWSHRPQIREREEEGLMGLTDVFLCPESHCPQIRERERKELMGLISVFLCAQSHRHQIRERRKELMGLTAVFLCPRSHIVLQIRKRGRAHGFDSHLSVPSHIILRLEREEGAHGFDDPSFCAQSHIVIRLERRKELMG